MQGSVEIRIGGIAADLARIVSFSQNPKSAMVVASLLDESRYFIEWTAPELVTDRLEDAVRLLNIQLELTFWHLKWHKIKNDANQRQRLADQAQAWSDEILKMSGLLEQE